MIEARIGDEPPARQSDAARPLVGIDRIFVVNLDRRPDRRRSFYAALPPEVRGSVERVAAEDSRQLRPTPELRHLFRDNDFGYRRGVLACALSHYLLWRRIADAGDSCRSVLLLEDDVIFTPGFWERWNSVHGRDLPTPHDLIYLGGPSLFPEEAEACQIRTREHRLAEDEFLAARPFRHFGVPKRMDYGTFAYLLTQDAARRLCRWVERDGIHRAVDWFLIDQWPRLHVYVTVPLLCWGVRNEASDVQQDPSVLFRKETLRPE